MMEPISEPLMTDHDITPDSLLADNKNSVQGIAEYMKAKERGSMYAIETCSDARVDPSFFLGDPTTEVRSISAAGRKGHLGHLLAHEGVRAALFVTHFDCGGLNAKANLAAVIDHVGEDVGQYVRERVGHHDPIIQAHRSAVRASRLTDKPVMAAVIDHLTGHMVPVTILLDGGKHNILAIPQYDLDHYDPKRIYTGGRLPEVDEAHIPDFFAELLANNRQQVERIAATDPQFSARQKIQNPALVTISTSAIPQAVRLPGICARPNTSFVIHAGYQKNNGVVTGIDSRHTFDVIAQAQYPLINALTAQSEADAFGRTHTVLIETPKMEWSRRLAEQLVAKNVAQLWRNKNPKSQIIIGAIEHGLYTEPLQIF